VPAFKKSKMLLYIETGFLSSFREKLKLCKRGFFFCKHISQLNLKVSALCYVRGGQGDHIGRIFPYWMIAYFGQFLENYRSSPKLWATLLEGKRNALCNFDKNVLGYILGNFFTKSSGHPGPVLGRKGQTYMHTLYIFVCMVARYFLIQHRYIPR
jgi:hypothetical protein